MTTDEVGSVKLTLASLMWAKNCKTNAKVSCPRLSSSGSSNRRNSIYNLPAKQNLRILTPNYRNILEKRSELSVLTDYVKADTVCATESWLHGIKPNKSPSHDHIKSSDVFPSNYTAYRHDRISFGGGVFTLVRDNLISTKVTVQHTKCKEHTPRWWLQLSRHWLDQPTCKCSCPWKVHPTCTPRYNRNIPYSGTRVAYAWAEHSRPGHRFIILRKLSFTLA